MRREQLYLQDILDACDMIQTFLAGLDTATFLASELHKAAILQKLTVIGEAAARLPQAFRDTHPQVEWRDIIASVILPSMRTLQCSGTLYGPRLTMMSHARL